MIKKKKNVYQTEVKIKDISTQLIKLIVAIIIYRNEFSHNMPIRNEMKINIINSTPVDMFCKHFYIFYFDLSFFIFSYYKIK